MNSKGWLASNRANPLDSCSPLASQILASQFQLGGLLHSLHMKTQGGMGSTALSHQPQSC